MSKQVKNAGDVPANVTAIAVDEEGDTVRSSALVEPGETVEVPDDFTDERFAAVAAPVAAPAPAPPAQVPEPAAEPAAPSQE